MNASGTGTLSMIGIVQAQQQQGIWFIFQVFPAGLHRVRDICHRHGCRNQPRSL